MCFQNRPARRGGAGPVVQAAGRRVDSGGGHGCPGAGGPRWWRAGRDRSTSGTGCVVWCSTCRSPTKPSFQRKVPVPAPANSTRPAPPPVRVPQPRRQPPPSMLRPPRNRNHRQPRPPQKRLLLLRPRLLRLSPPTPLVAARRIRPAGNTAAK